MIFFHFCFFSFGVLQECVAENQIPEISNEYKLVQHHVITNCGSHSPFTTFLPRENRGTWQCDPRSENSSYSSRHSIFPIDLPREIHTIIDKRYAEYPPNCGLGSITVEGMNQVSDLGSNYRKFLFETHHLINEKINLDEILIRSTFEEHSYQTAVSFVSGLFKNLNNGKIINIVSGTKNKEIIVPNKNQCKDLNNLISSFENSDDAQKEIEFAKSELSSIFQLFDIKSPTKKNIINICEWINSMKCNDQILESNISNKFKSCQNILQKLRFGAFSSDRGKIGVAASPVMREILRNIDNFMNQSKNIKFSLIAAEDTTIAAILSLLKNEKLNDQILLASHLSFSVLQKDDFYYLQVFMNGKPLNISDRNILKYDEFKIKFEKLINYCHELP
ncbi:histidine acid phosphatase [Tritrichomonas foetus]|uniref:Histidine acid phosphatase n=1 Tax=Tritrichomonas foetus TaxID=1144522 RepID=A0A1J4JWT2_9EUKA|nr:histidine acid phosphatase [Tritrichomonas foetus]|eukprot:OHT01733.1 histidine acid phosphatase [Tritrichomonas foetus]